MSASGWTPGIVAKAVVDPAETHRTYIKPVIEVDPGTVVMISTERINFQCGRQWAAQVGEDFNMMIETCSEIAPQLAEWLIFVRKYTRVKETEVEREATPF